MRSSKEGHSSNFGHQNKNRMKECHMAVNKVDLPLLDGEDPVGWLTHAETYFQVQGIAEEVKVKLAKLSMEGSIIHWFNLMQEIGEIKTNSN